MFAWWNFAAVRASRRKRFAARSSPPPRGKISPRPDGRGSLVRPHKRLPCRRARFRGRADIRRPFRLAQVPASPGSSTTIQDAACVVPSPRSWETIPEYRPRALRDNAPRIPLRTHSLRAAAASRILPASVSTRSRSSSSSSSGGKDVMRVSKETNLGTDNWDDLPLGSRQDSKDKRDAFGFMSLGRKCRHWTSHCFAFLVSM